MDAVEQVAAIRAQLWDAGFRPVPVFNYDHPDPKVAGKAPLGKDWGNRARQDPPECINIPPVAHALNTGILCDGLRAIDIDVDDPDVAQRCRAMVVHRFGEAPIRMRRNSPRCLILYRATEGTPAKLVLAGTRGKIEVLGKGQQFVAFGRHPTGAELEWFPDAPGEESLQQLPAIDENALTDLLEELAPIVDAAPPQRVNGHEHAYSGEAQADPLRVAAAFNEIPNNGPADWESWNRVGMAAWSATGGSELGFAAFDAWSARHPSYDAAETRARWDHYFNSPPDRTGAGKLFRMAKEAKPRHPEEPQEEPPATSAQFPATGVTWEEMESIEPRQWVYGHFLIRRFISAIGAPGGAGKTAYAYAVALCIMTGSDLLQETVHDPGNVWIYNLEDPRDELLRRLKAALMGHGIEFAEIADRIFLDSGRTRPLVIAQTISDGTVVAWPMVPALIAELKARNIRLLIVDPFVRSHKVEENANDQIDAVAALWAMVADQADCAILLVHHFKKGGVSGDAAAFRGASALIDASRAAVTLSTMSQDDARKFNIPDDTRWQYIRADNAKLNLAPPPESAVWLKLTSVDIENGRAGRPSDHVQTVTRWTPAASAWADFPMPTIIHILDALAAGPGDGEQYTLTRGGRSTRWAGNVIVQIAGKNEVEAAKVLRAWVESGLILSGRYVSPKQRRERDGLIVDPAKFAELRMGSGSASWPDETC